MAGYMMPLKLKCQISLFFFFFYFHGFMAQIDWEGENETKNLSHGSN